MLAIRTENLSKTYRGNWRGRGRTCGLRGLNLEVRPGEVFGFLGPNGAGKTTTFHLLLNHCAERPPDNRIEHGQVTILCRDTASRRKTEELLAAHQVQVLQTEVEAQSLEDIFFSTINGGPSP